MWTISAMLPNPTARPPVACPISSIQHSWPLPPSWHTCFSWLPGHRSPVFHLYHCLLLPNLLCWPFFSLTLYVAMSQGSVLISLVLFSNYTDSLGDDSNIMALNTTNMLLTSKGIFPTPTPDLYVLGCKINILTQHAQIWIPALTTKICSTLSPLS